MSRPIDAEELLKAMDSHDKFGIDSHGFVRRLSKDRYGDSDLVPYVHYKDMTDAVENMPTIHAIPIDKVKAVREEISKVSRDSYEELAQTFYNDAIKDAVEILDKLIKESENP